MLMESHVSNCVVHKTIPEHQSSTFSTPEEHLCLKIEKKKKKACITKPIEDHKLIWEYFIYTQIFTVAAS